MKNGLEVAIELLKSDKQKCHEILINYTTYQAKADAAVRQYENVCTVLLSHIDKFKNGSFEIKILKRHLILGKKN